MLSRRRVSLVYVESGQAYPRYRASNEIAGDRFDRVVADMLLDEFARQHGPARWDDLTPESRQLLKRRAEEAKIGLSRATDVPVPIMIDLMPDKDLMPVRLRREELKLTVAASEWAVYTNGERLKWLLNESHTTVGMRPGRVAVMESADK